MFEKNNTHHKIVISILVICMAALTGINMLFNYFVVTGKIQRDVVEKEYKLFGGKENYEKSIILQGAQTKLQMKQSPYGNMSVDEVRKEVDKQLLNVLSGDNSSNNEDTQDGNNSGDTYKITKDFSKYESNIKDGRYILGPTDAKITVYEFSDISCPFCKQLHNSSVKENLFNDYSGSINFVFKNFPIPQLHPQAHLQAVAALCLADQTNNALDYYKYLDGEFNSAAKSKNALLNLATKNFNIDETAFTTCLDSGKFDELIEGDINEGGNKYGITGTPGSVIINNETGKTQIIRGAAQYPAFKSAVEALIN